MPVTLHSVSGIIR